MEYKKIEFFKKDKKNWTIKELLEIVSEAEKGNSETDEICRKYKITFTTYKYLHKIYSEEGKKGLEKLCLIKLYDDDELN